MCVEFYANVPETARPDIVTLLTDTCDDDLDVKFAARSQTAGYRAVVTSGWHQNDGESLPHVTVRVFLAGQLTYTAHVYRNGQITAFG